MSQSPRDDLVTSSEFRPVAGIAEPESARTTRFINDDKEVAVTREVRFAGLDLKGRPTDDESVMAVKSVVENNIAQFFVRVSVRGTDRGFFADPKGAFFSMADFLDGERRYAFRQVGADVYTAYAKYLATGIEANLRRAERMWNNAQI